MFDRTRLTAAKIALWKELHFMPAIEYTEADYQLYFELNNDEEIRKQETPNGEPQETSESVTAG